MAAAWVTLRHLGQDGYLKLAKNLQNTVKILIDGCNKIEVHLYFFSILKRYQINCRSYCFLPIVRVTPYLIAVRSLYD